MNPLHPFLTGMGQSNLPRATAPPAQSQQLLQGMLQARLGPQPNQQFFLPGPRGEPDMSLFAHKLQKPRVTNSFIDDAVVRANEVIKPGSVNGGGGTPTVPGPTSVNPGVPGGTGGAFDRPGDPALDTRGATDPAFDRPFTGGPSPYGSRGVEEPPPIRPADVVTLPGGRQAGGPGWFEITESSPYYLQGGNPGDNLIPPPPPHDQALYRNLVSMFGPRLGPQMFAQHQIRSQREQRGGPGPGNAATGTPVGTESSAGLAAGYGNEGSAGNPGGFV